MPNPAARTWLFYNPPTGMTRRDIIFEGDAIACQQVAASYNDPTMGSIKFMKDSGMIQEGSYALAVAAPFAWDFNKPFTGK